jgi:hypothetical protein
MTKRRPTLLDRVIESIDQRIKWLQAERVEILELAASQEAGRTARTSTPRASAPRSATPRTAVMEPVSR